MIYGVIMAGGSGTRFWPKSRRNRPKQLLAISGDKTMIQATVERILPEIPYDRIMVITGSTHEEEVRKQLPGLPPEMVVVEPVGRNTAPCIALAAYKLRKQNPDAIMAVLPADHLIGKAVEFLDALRIGAEAAATSDYLLTFGILPDRPETGYGYIKLGPTEIQIRGTPVHRVEGFVEKPNRDTAEKYLSSGRYLWNSGMFMWNVSAIVKAFQTHLPGLADAVERILPALNTPEELNALRELYSGVEAVSIDYGIMEKAANTLCIPVDVEWNDVGSWASLADVWLPDEQGNSATGEVVFLESRDCVVSSPHRLTALIGMEELVVVDTPDAIMICRKDRAQDVKKLREELEKRGYDHLL